MQGIGVRATPATDAAWQTAHLIGVIQTIDRTLVQDAAGLDGLQREIRDELFASITAKTGIDAYQTENLIPSLMADASVIKNYVDGSRVMLIRYHQFLERYDSSVQASENLE